MSERENSAADSTSVSEVVLGGNLSRSETCPDHRHGLRFYRNRHQHWLKIRGARPSTRPVPPAHALMPAGWPPFGV